MMVSDPEGSDTGSTHHPRCFFAAKNAPIADPAAVNTSAAGSPIVGQSQIARSRAHIENGQRADRRRQPGSLPAPVAVDIQAQQVIEEVVAWRDVTEHAANARFFPVEEA